MNDMIDKKTLKILNDNMDILDNEGLWEFIESIIHCDEFDSTSPPHRYTLAIFLMGLYDDDIDSLVEDLISEGWHKWEGLHKWNKYRSDLSTDIQKIYEGMLFSGGGIPSYEELEKGSGTKCIQIDYNKYKNRVDFTCTKDSGSLPCSLPVIRGLVPIDQFESSMYDKLYAAVIRTDLGEAEYIKDSHYAYNFEATASQSKCDAEDGPIVYMTLEEVLDYLHNDLGKHFDSRAHVCTALPREILERYNLPIYRGK